MRTFTIIAVVLGALAVTSVPAQAAEVKIAFVNTARVLEQAPQAKAARERIQQEFSPRDAELTSAQKSMKALQERLEKDGQIMSESERSKLERDLVTQQREFKRAQGEFSEDLNLRRNEEFAKLQREASDAVVAIAKDESYDLVFESGVVFASDKVDITDKVVARMRDQHSKQAGKAKK